MTGLSRLPWGTQAENGHIGIATSRSTVRDLAAAAAVSAGLWVAIIVVTVRLI